MNLSFRMLVQIERLDRAYFPMRILGIGFIRAHNELTGNNQYHFLPVRRRNDYRFGQFHFFCFLTGHNN